MDQELKDWLKEALNKNPTLLQKARAGDFMAAQQWIFQLSSAMTAAFEEVVYKSTEFLEATNKAQADIVRKVIAPVIEQVKEVSDALSYESLQKNLVKKGLLFSPAQPERVEDRLKAVVAGGLKKVFDEEDLEAGLNIFRSGFQQVIDSSPRSTLTQTALKAEQMGFSLEGRRVPAVYADACSYCQEAAHTSFSLKEGLNFAGFHDYCSCRLEIL